ncbi:MAG: hypothetical protein QME96_16800, partial [Myxococcota bacterium]|nr:hypothetical protein [Myxococcota bacterium]
MMGRNVGIMRTGWLLAALALAAPRTATAQTQIKPYMMIVFDTSGSMNWNYAGSDTSGDGSRDPWGARWCCPGTGTAANPSRLYPCKSAMYRMVAATGDVIFGLTKFPQYWRPGGRQMDWYLNNQVAGARDVLRYDGECSSATVTDYRVVPFGEESANEVLMWMDHREYSAANTPISATERELRADGPTPIAWTLDRTREYFGGVLGADPYWNCRPYRVLLLTDGEDNCAPGNPAGAVTALRTTARTGGGTKDVRTCVIGYGSPGLAQLNAMALAGRCFDTTTTAYVPTNENELAVALFEIVRGTVLTEICNNLDDDCDGL